MTTFKVTRTAAFLAGAIGIFVPCVAGAQSRWAQLPRMQLERQFAGPLQDTIIQRWRDPVDKTICYIYLPITAVHSAPIASGYVQYGANVIGTISCFAEPHPVAAPKPLASSKKSQGPNP